MSVVYFIEAVGLDLIKIGFTAGPVERRLRGLACVSPAPLRCLGIVDGGLLEEAKLHARFAHLLDHAEWYAAGSELVQYIADHAIVVAVNATPLLQPDRRPGDTRTLTFACPSGFGAWLMGYAIHRDCHVGYLIQEGLLIEASQLGVPAPPSVSAGWSQKCPFDRVVSIGSLSMLCDRSWKGWIAEHSRSTNRKMSKTVRRAIERSAMAASYPLATKTFSV